MNRYSDLIFQGLETLLQGLILPFIMSVFGSLVQVALQGWQGFRVYIANYFCSLFLAVISHWILLRYDMPGEYKAVIIGMSSLISYNVLRYLTSKSFLTVILQLIGKRIKTILGINSDILIPENAAETENKAPKGDKKDS